MTFLIPYLAVGLWFAFLGWSSFSYYERERYWDEPLRAVAALVALVLLWLPLFLVDEE